QRSDMKQPNQNLTEVGKRRNTCRLFMRCRHFPSASNLNFCTLPDDDFGKSRTMVISLGTLKPANWLRQKPCSSTGCKRLPSRSTTAALNSSPQRSLDTP